jgi:hypothetical protein
MSWFNTLTGSVAAAERSLAGNDSHNSLEEVSSHVHDHSPHRPADPGVAIGHSTDPGHQERPAPPGDEARANAARQGMAWNDEWGCWVASDTVDRGNGSDVATYSNPDVVTHDHSNANPSTWTIDEWKAAFKRDPEKYTRLFQDLATTPDGLSKDVQDHKAEMNNLVATVVQDFNRDMTLLKSLIDANHETQKSLAQFRV